MATNHSSKQPANTLRCGNNKTTIWQNVSEKGYSLFRRQPGGSAPLRTSCMGDRDMIEASNVGHLL